MRVKRLFSEEVKHRQAERDHTLSLSHGQRYVLKELRIYFGTLRTKTSRRTSTSWNEPSDRRL